ncbi:MAG: TonB-dependent receptor [Bacteroidales bacterium]|nr:TonB-dependent receptor [Bacteroidales bacterium]
MRRDILKHLSAVIFFVISIVASAQNVQLSGVVKDAETGEGVIGASVMMKGTTNGTVTDLDGNFSLSVPSGADILISALGYDDYALVAAAGMASLNILMRASTQFLDEIVVVGYGTQKKVNLTGAVSTVNFEDLAESRPVTSIASALAGTSAGLSVRTTSSDPGNESNTIRIRGTGTLNSSSPLYIVDGVESSMSYVNAHDIATITILKDAASCAIYGNRGANGVVLITTKQGSEGRVNVTYSGNVSFNSPMHKLSYLTDYADYMELMNESLSNIGQAENFLPSTIQTWRNAKNNPDGIAESGYPNYVAYPNTDWQDCMYRNVASHEHNISVSGKGGKASYLISANYMYNPGLISNTAARKYQVRANIDVQPTQWLTVGMQTYGSVLSKQSGDFSTAVDYIGKSTPGVYPYYGGYYGFPAANEESATASNPLYTVNEEDAIRTNSRIKVSGYAKIDFLKDFSFKTLVNYGRYWYDYQSKPVVPQPVKMNFATGVQMTTPPPTETMETWFRANGDWDYTIQTTLHWNHTFGGHHELSALLGYEEYYSYEYNHNGTKKGLVAPSIWVADTAVEPLNVGGSASDYSSRSFFGRLNYVLFGRYLFEANLRCDGSSRFASTRRWGVFPSFSAGWRIDQERFMKNSGFDLLKIRASWGRLGNNSIGNYEYQSTYAARNYSFNNVLYNGLAVGTYANNDLRWETTTSTDIGIDLGVLDNRLTAEIDFYNKLTDGILYRPTIYLTAGEATAPRENIAEVTNRGVELTLGWRSHVKDFSYSVSGNFSYNYNRVTKYKGKLNEYWQEAPSGIRTYVSNLGDVSTGGSTRILEGHTINEYYMLTPYQGNASYFDDKGRVIVGGGPRDGMIRTELDMLWLKAMIAEGYNFRPQEGVGKDKIWYGDYIYADIDGDGIYGNTYDNVFTGKSSTPMFNYGFQASFSWKGIDIQMSFAGAAGFWLYWNSTGATSTGTRIGYNILSSIAKDHYFYDPDHPNDPRTNTTSKTARLTANEKDNQQGATSVLHLYKGDYLKMKNLTIGYSLPEHIANKIFMKGLRVYVSGENLFSITSYPGQDPEMGADLGYVTMRQISLGVNLTF